MKKKELLKLSGCKEHNLKNINVTLPKGCIVAITGVSGSGKSSLAYDTIYSEAQRRYLEYLSPDVRTQIKLLSRSNVDYIDGLSPALATGHSSSSYGKTTISTHTDIYDFLTLLYVKTGIQHSPATSKRLECLTRPEIVERILSTYPEKSRIQLIAPIKKSEESREETLNRLLASGFVRVLINGIESSEIPDKNAKIEVVVDRLVMKEDVRERLTQSVETALDLSKGVLRIQEGSDGKSCYFTEIYVCPESGMSFPPLSSNDFNYRSTKGACPACSGKGTLERVNFNNYPWDPKRAFFEQVTPFLKLLPVNTRKATLDALQELQRLLKIDKEAPFEEVSKENLSKVIEGLETPLRLKGSHVILNWKGLNKLFESASKAPLPFATSEICSLCKGGRLKPESLHSLIDGQSIASLDSMEVSMLLQVLPKLKIEKKAIAKEILPEILTRLNFLKNVGLGYLELNRPLETLSDGESQRVELASLLGANMSGILYILDEPSRGLHALDTEKLQEVIEGLVGYGSSVIIVEHERNLIHQADHVLEMGPGAGRLGGEVVFQGTPKELEACKNSPTGSWLSESQKLQFSDKKSPKEFFFVENASCHNLKNFSAKIPLERMTVFTGVSGSGKSTLAFDVIGKLVLPEFERINLVPQRRVGSSSRSIPATYIGIMDHLRKLYASTRLAKARGYTASRFSLNTRGGRCEACQGLGIIKVSMQLIADMTLPCEVCSGKRYNYETLQVTWDGHTISEVLEMPADKAYAVFKDIPAIESKLKLLCDLGLDYLSLGQSLATLSGGEGQRLRLICDLAAASTLKTLYIIDEPSAGLHFQDIKKLLRVFDALVEAGNTLIVIEHNLEIIAHADWALELGPVGGPGGGQLLFSGTPKELAKTQTPTGKALNL